jgi:hypothetical protein
MPAYRNGRMVALGALMLSALALGGCASSIAELPIIGTPSDAPRPKDPAGYLPVEEMPPARDQAAIAPDEQAKIKKELLAARDRQASTIKDQGPNQGQGQNPGSK